MEPIEYVLWVSVACLIVEVLNSAGIYWTIRWALRAGANIVNAVQMRLGLSVGRGNPSAFSTLKGLLPKRGSSQSPTGGDDGAISSSPEPSGRVIELPGGAGRVDIDKLPDEWKGLAEQYLPQITGGTGTGPVKAPGAPTEALGAAIDGLLSGKMNKEELMGYIPMLFQAAPGEAGQSSKGSGGQKEYWG